MSGGERRNLAASVIDRLHARARAGGEDLQQLLTRYALERLLYRLSVSDQRDRFLLKGAMLFAAWAAQPHRPTRDLDLLGYGDPSTEAVTNAFRVICATAVAPDGLVFDTATIVAAPMKEDEDYTGVRLALDAHLGSARVRVLIDVGFGDAVTPAPEELLYPVLLDFPAPRLRTYPRETVIAEKVHAMTTLGIANSRMKDFYDVWVLSETYAFRGPPLAAAIGATFTRRGTPLPVDVPLPLTTTFSSDARKQSQWHGFLNKAHLREAPELTALIDALRTFLLPPLTTAKRETPLHAVWAPGGPWTLDEQPPRAHPDV